MYSSVETNTKSGVSNAEISNSEAKIQSYNEAKNSEKKEKQVYNKIKQNSVNLTSNSNNITNQNQLSNTSNSNNILILNSESNINQMKVNSAKSSNCDEIKYDKSNNNQITSNDSPLNTFGNFNDLDDFDLVANDHMKNIDCKTILYILLAININLLNDPEAMYFPDKVNTRSKSVPRNKIPKLDFNFDGKEKQKVRISKNLYSQITTKLIKQSVILIT